MVQLLVITVPSNPNAQRNLAAGIDQSVWGFPRSQTIPTGAPVLLGTQFDHPSGNRNPRRPAEVYRQGTMEILVLGRATAPAVTDPAYAPLWPDELAKDSIIYPCRFPLSILGQAANWSLTDHPDLAEAFRRSHINNGNPVPIDVDPALLDELAHRAGMSEWPHLGELPPAAQIRGNDVSTHRQRRGAGWVQDTPTRQAIEKHAVALAVAHYQQHGWDVEELGKPYDLRCTAPGRPELHVEVKGTMSLGATIELTSNEVAHAHNHPTDLAIITNIHIHRGDDNTPQAHSGTLHIFENWTPTHESLRATRYTHEVPWQTHPPRAFPQPAAAKLGRIEPQPVDRLARANNLTFPTPLPTNPIHNQPPPDQPRTPGRTL